MEFMKKNTKWIILGGNIIAILGLFLPFMTVSASIFSKSINYIEGDGIFVLVALIVACGLLFLKNNKYTLIPLGIAFGITLFTLVNLNSGFGEYRSVYGSLVKFNFGIGFYLLLLGLIISVGVTIYTNFIIKSNKVLTAANNQIYQGDTTVNTVQQNAENNPQTVANNVNCPNCGGVSNNQSMFCANCGTKLK